MLEPFDALEPRLLFTTSPVYNIRVNQVAYLPNEPKTALVLTDANRTGKSFEVRDRAGAAVKSFKVGRDRGAYAQFDHVYELDISKLRTRGRYRIFMGNDSSPLF